MCPYLFDEVLAGLSHDAIQVEPISTQGFLQLAEFGFIAVLRGLSWCRDGGGGRVISWEDCNWFSRCLGRGGRSWLRKRSSHFLPVQEGRCTTLWNDMKSFCNEPVINLKKKNSIYNSYFLIEEKAGQNKHNETQSNIKWNRQKQGMKSGQGTLMYCKCNTSPSL